MIFKATETLVWQSVKLAAINQ